jgi:hypothetical protein
MNLSTTVFPALAIIVALMFGALPARTANLELTEPAATLRGRLYPQSTWRTYRFESSARV